MHWLLRRVGVSALLIWVVASVVFLAIRLVPGDPVNLLLSHGGVAPNPVAAAALREQLGLDRPALAQYVVSFSQVLHGDFGQSLQDGSPVADEIWLRLPRTLELVLVATMFAVLFGIPSGLLVAVRPGGMIDRFSALLSALVQSIPTFVIGALLLLLFARILHWLPAGTDAPQDEDPLQHLVLVAMPAFVIGVGLAATLARTTRIAVLDLSQRRFVRTARAKGLTRMRVLLRHILRNALMPIVTVLASHLGTILGATVLVEYLFNYPGLSGLLVEAVNARDYPVVEGIVVVLSVLLVMLNLALDLLYALLDPRVRTA
jgi:peptide/nickel transport system permease protein